jgi:lactate permease
VGLVGKESELFRFTVKHSFIMLLVVCLLTVMQAYLFTWIVPAYELVLATAAPPQI